MYKLVAARVDGDAVHWIASFKGHSLLRHDDGAHQAVVGRHHSRFWLKVRLDLRGAICFLAILPYFKCMRSLAGLEMGP